ncbi:MAG: hypothetical protein WA814_07760 [Candidatus Baltobacteraceae bacterium]
MWSAIGTILALASAAAAWLRSRGRGGFYDLETYGMSARAHRRYAAVFLAFALYFAVAHATGRVAAGIAGLALYALVALFYATSFLQGAPDRDE